MKYYELLSLLNIYHCNSFKTRVPISAFWDYECNGPQLFESGHHMHYNPNKL